MNRKRLFISRVGVLALALTVLWLSSATVARLLLAPVDPTVCPTSPPTYVTCPTRPPTRADSYTVCPDGPPTCDYATIQAAVDVACDGDVVKVAGGTYTGVVARPKRSGDTPGQHNSGCPAMIAQTVYINKSITIRGGYTTTFADPPDPNANPTTLDAQGQGRVLYIEGQVSPTIEGLRITGGDAAGLGGRSWHRVLGTDDVGGGVYANGAPFNFINNHVYGNTAVHGGGGMYLFLSDATLTGNVVSSNTVSVGRYGNPDAVANGGGGGGLLLDYSNASLDDNVVSNNTTDQEGGGLLLVHSDASLDGNVVSNNSAESGGGLSLRDGAINLNQNTITSNTATGLSGGGLLVLYSEATLDGNTITRNTSGHGGGGVYLAFSRGTWSNNLIAHNRVDSVEGGAEGSGILVYNGPDLCLLHTTIACNTGGDASGIVIAHSPDFTYTVFLSNTILVSHTVGIIVWDGNAATLEATLWGAGEWANETDWAGAGDIVTGTINVWGSPDFIDPGTGDYHVGPASAAVDRGVDAGVVDDMDGEPRPRGSGHDIGADESGL